MDLSNLVMIIVVILLLTYFMSNNLNRKEVSNESDTSTLSLENNNNQGSNSNGNNSNEINSNISGNNVNFSNESFQTTDGSIPMDSSITASVESYSTGYLFNVDLVDNTTNNYFIELYNPKNEMLGVLHKEKDREPIIATKDSTNMNQYFNFIPLTLIEKNNLEISSAEKVFTIKSIGEVDILHYDGQLSVQPIRDGMKLNKGHVFIAREEKKRLGISEYQVNRGAELNKTFNLDGTMSVNDYNNNLFTLVQNINRKVSNLYNREQVNKEEDNESNGLINGPPINITVLSGTDQSKSPFINSRSSKKTIAEKFQEIDNNTQNRELQKLVQETVVSSNAEIKCPQLDVNRYIHVEDVDCMSCPKQKN
jgi:hypothetical protein